MKQTLTILVLLSVSAARGGTLPGPRSTHLWWPEDAKVAIEWQDTWDETVDANTKRWAKELQTERRELRARRLGLRMVRLYEALLARHGQDPEKRILAYRGIAESYRRGYFNGRSCYYLRRLAEEFPGRTDLAVLALHTILGYIGEAPHETVEGLDWLEYATRRLLALRDAGHLSESHPAAVAALRARVLLCRTRRDFVSADEAVSRLERITANDLTTQFARGDLLFVLDRHFDAVPFFQSVYERTEHWHPRNRLYDMREDAPVSPPTFPGKFGLEMRWETAQDDRLELMLPWVDRLIRDDSTGSSLTGWGKERHTSIWHAVDRHLRSQEPDKLKGLRASQDAAVAERLTSARAKGEAGLLALFREFPWASASHTVLVELGEREVRRGHGGLALRCFQDVLDHAIDPAVRTRAQAGLWLALAQAGERETLARALQAAGDGSVRWLGRQVSAKTVRERLASTAEEALAPAPSLGKLGRRLLRLPARTAWPHRLLWGGSQRWLSWAFAAPLSLVPCDGGVLACGPDLLAFYPDGDDRAAWVRRRTRPDAFQGKVRSAAPQFATVPGAFLPACVDGMVFSRWGLGPMGHVPAGVTAVDLATGRMQWSTLADPAWEGLWPVSDPAEADGRLYLLAIRRGRHQVLPLVPVLLVCLDASSGEMLWKQHVASQALGLPVSGRSEYARKAIDLIHYGNPVTVRGGAVLCSSNAGFVARCDARDGAVEWVRTYPRSRPRHTLLDLVRREGASPIAAGDKVVFVPRDRLGVFALDRATGAPVWENPHVPSQGVAGRLDKALLTYDAHHVAAVDLASGAVRWHRRFDDGLISVPRLVGQALVVGLPEGLVSLDAATGRRLAVTAWGQPQPMAAFIVRGGQVVGVSAEPEGSERGEMGRPLAKGAEPRGSGPTLPVTQVWHLPRSGPRLLDTPPELGGNIFLLSEGMIECIDVRERGSVRWRRGMPPGAARVHWTQGRLLLRFPRRILAIDGKTGRLLWDAATPFRVREMVVAPPHLFLGRWDPDRRYWDMASLDLATGAVEWEHDLRELRASGYDGVHEAVWDGGERVVLIARLTRGKAGIYTIPIRLKDGHALGVQPFRESGDHWVRVFAADAKGGFYVDRHKAAWAFTLDGGTKHARLRANFGALHDRPNGLWGEVNGKWYQVNQYIYYPHTRTHWILKRGDPNYELIRQRPGTVRGDRLYEVHDHTVLETDLPSRKERAQYAVGVPEGRKVDILAHHSDRGRMLVVSGLYGGKAWDPEPRGLRLDLFEDGTGRLLASQNLDGPAYWNLEHAYDYEYREHGRTRALFRDGMLYLTDMHGLWAYAPVPETEREDLPRPLVHRVKRAPVLDGSLDDWVGAEAVVLRGPGGRQGRLFLTHDRESLFLGLTCPDAEPRPRVGRGDYGAGDWLELALTTRDGSHRWGVGLDRQAQPVWESLGGNGAIGRLRAGVRHDAARRQTVYELGIPLDAVVRKSSDWRRMGLSLTQWDEDTGKGPQRVLTWGGAIDGRMLLPSRHEEIYVHAVTAESEDAGFVIARELPEYGIGWKLLLDACRIRTRRPYSRVVIPRFVEFLRRRRDGPAAQRALVLLDQLLRSSPEHDPSAEILALAEKAGVSEHVRRRYARLARSRLSQWVYLDPKRPPTSFMIRLASAHDDDAWHHRVYWGHAEWSRQGDPHTPSRRHIAAMPEPGKWHELRVPLIWLGVQDRPIHGISFWVDGGRMVWDRTAVQYDGGERVLVEDKTPEGRAEGGWQWVANPRRSGGRAHTNPGDSSRRQLGSLAEPVWEHVPPPLAGPYVSQWVYIDNKQPPKSLTFSAMRRSNTRLSVVWGRPLAKHRYAGPLPPAGRWHELKIPLDGTWLAGLSIDGFGFGHDGGRVVWDRTAVVAHGREQIVIDDDVPTGSRSGDWQWVADPVRSGTKAHTQPVRAGYHGHALSRFRDHVTLHLGADRARRLAVLQEQIPKLGPTRVAYDAFVLLLDAAGSETADRVPIYRWFASAFPTHQQTPSVLTRLYAYYRGANPETAAEIMGTFLREAGVPRPTRYAFNVGNGIGGSAALRDWRVIGPFPNPGGQGHDRACPPETEPVRLTKAYDGVDGPVRWKLLRSDTDIIDLNPHFDPNDGVVAYAACWVHVDRGQFASLEVGSDDGCKMWVNDKLVLDRNVERSVALRSDRARVYLKKGWNRVLLKVVETASEWGFVVELFDTEGCSLLPDVRVSTAPPRE